ncbi:MAG: filamentous hemagglutinin N-terminal domain-containing protein [Cyanobacteria bacterium P01_D01_bin.156]
MLYRGLGVSLLLCLIGLPVLAQVSEDSTVGTVVSGTGPFTVTGGTQELTTLFHSFSEFSPGTNDVTFALDGGQNMVNVVIGRVTGSNASFLDGQLSLTGGNSPDLFLINPNGISFGSNASLSLPGSFIPSTAESVLFSHGLEFNAATSNEAPLLTVSTPAGLQFGAEASTSQPTLEVVNTGHSIVNAGLSLLTGGGGDVGLRIAPQETLALIGHDIRLSGGIVSNTLGGHLHLGSPQSGTVELKTSPAGWDFDYINVSDLGNITLNNRALVDTSSLVVGHLTVNTQTLNLENGSLLLAQNYGSQSGTDLDIQATDDINIIEVDSSGGDIIPSGIVSSTFGTGNGSTVNLTADNLSMRSGGRIVANSFIGSGQGGDVKIQVDDTLNLAEVGGNTSASLLGAVTGSSGNAGDVWVTGNQLLISGGASLSTFTLDSGNSGTLSIDMSERVDIEGFSLAIGQASNLAATTLGSGNAGDVLVNTPQLNLRNTGRLDSSTTASGNAGNITVNATQGITVEGGIQTPIQLLSSISSSADIPSDTFRSIFGLPAIPTGNAGNVTLITPSLVVEEGAEVAVKSLGTGEGGTLTINAEQISLDQGGQLSALTTAGNGGNISLTVDRLLLMRRNSLINAESRNIGDGGNIVLASPIILGLENSDIVANAVSGDGGNISITTRGLLGLEFRDQLTAGNDITASSELGVTGTVEINNFVVNPDSGLVELPIDLVDTSKQIAQGCTSSGNEFIATGRGGIPNHPTQGNQNRFWTDIRNLASEPSHSTSTLPLSPSSQSSVPLTEATTWHTNTTGQIELAVATNQRELTSYTTCSGISVNHL